MIVSILSYGAVADGKTDNHNAIQAAFDYAAANGDSVYIPPGTFAYSGNLTANGIAVAGSGDGSILKALTPANESVILTGSGGSIENLQLDGNNSAGRLDTFQSGMVWASGATNYTIQNVHINGSASVGIVSDNSSNGQVLNNTVENTLADSIHTTDGSHNITISENLVKNSGDDGISVVSYTGQPISHDITIQGNSVLNNVGGRGMSVVGGDNVTMTGNHVEGGSNGMAGIYISAEAEWHTQGVSNVTVNGNTLINAGGSASGHGAITVYNSQAGSETITGVVLENNQILNPEAAGVLITGAGPEQVTMTNNTLYANGHPMLTNGDSAASVTNTGSQTLASSAYPGPLVPSGGGIGSGGSTPAPTATATPAPAPTATATPAPTSTAAAGSDSIVIHASADGAATFHVLVDGKAVGTEQTATAAHDNGTWQDITLSGNFGLASGSHQIVLQADNASAATNTALYVGSMSVDGTVLPAISAVNTASAGHSDASDAPMLTSGSLTFSTGSAAVAAAVQTPAPVATTAPAPTTSTTAPAAAHDSIVIHTSADANTTFHVLVDGKPVGGEQTATAPHDAGVWQNITLSGNFGLSTGTHQVAIQTDTVTTGSNALYVGSLKVDGHRLAATDAVNTAGLGHSDPHDAPMLTNGTLTFTTGATHAEAAVPATASTGVSGHDSTPTLADLAHMDHYIHH
ncbi:MAG TPA: right-handed parallel beta-helix repeat-containing protein [Patescibacteria group bacterium]|nr:right-handed parallel beta-helix repeat-containing protein [Patescibacteria group bacterium]